MRKKSVRESKILLILMASILSNCLWSFGQGTTVVDASSVEADGTAHLSRAVPVPKTISPESQAFLRTPFPPFPPNLTLDAIKQLRVQADAMQAKISEDALKLYPVEIEEGTIAGIPVKTFLPLNAPADAKKTIRSRKCARKSQRILTPACMRCGTHF
jgi:epsilon-lactone hydrolase